MLWRLIVIVFVVVSTRATVTLVQESEEVCPGNSVTLTCSVNTGFLRWQSVDGSSRETYLSDSSPGTVSFLEGFSINLTNVSGTMLTSTATLTNATQSVALQCFDGMGNTETRNIDVLQDAASLIFCTQPFDTFNNGSIKVSWNLPVISPQCCTSYSLKLTPQNNSSPLLVFNSTNNSTIITGLVRDVTYAARVMCVTPKGTVLTSEPRDIKNDTRSCSVETMVKYPTFDMIEVSLVHIIEVPPRYLFCPIFKVIQVECCNASVNCSTDEKNKVCRYNTTDIQMQYSSITVYISTDFGYNFSLKISEDFRDVIDRIMELQDSLEDETHTRMQFFTATVTLSVLLVLIMVVLLVLGAIFCALTLCSYTHHDIELERCPNIELKGCPNIELERSPHSEIKRSQCECPADQTKL